jgi:hypothetical protein
VSQDSEGFIKTQIKKHIGVDLWETHLPMPKDQFTLPTGENVTVIYGAKHPGKGTTYLNAVRMGPVDENSDMAVEYHGMEKHYASLLAALVKCEIPDFDAVVSPPSSRPDAMPYREAVLRNTSAHDLTRHFSRKGKVKIGHNDTTLDQAIDEMIYARDGTEPDIESLLIVDESIASGKTVAAMLHHMRQAGLTE